MWQLPHMNASKFWIVVNHSSCEANVGSILELQKPSTFLVTIVFFLFFLGGGFFSGLNNVQKNQVVHSTDLNVEMFSFKRTH